MVSRIVAVILVLILAVAAAIALAGAANCDHCGKPLVGKYRIVDGKNLHEGCFLDHYALRCSQCNKPILENYTIFQGKNYHSACYTRTHAKFCTICDREIEGQYYENAWGDLVHAAHIGEYPPCDYCGRLKAPKLTGKGLRYLDGREICGVCLSTAVTRIANARGLLLKARDRLRQRGIVIKHDFELKLINKTEMARIGPSDHDDLRGFAELKSRSALFGAVTEKKIKIFALTGMPRDILLGVLAHELMHVWMFTNCPKESADVLAEGSCEYAAYLVLKEEHSDLVRYYLDSMEERDDPTYGIGYRKVSAFVQSVGIESWLDYLKEHPAPPWR